MARRVIAFVMVSAVLIGLTWLLWPSGRYPTKERTDSDHDLKMLLLAIELCSTHPDFELPAYESGNGSSAWFIRELTKSGIASSDSVAKGILLADTRAWGYRVPKALVGKKWAAVSASTVVLETIPGSSPLPYAGITKVGRLVKQDQASQGD